MTYLRRYLVAGLLVWLPLGASYLVVSLLVDWMDRSLLLLPQAYRPESLLGFHIPGLGVVLSLVILFVTGLVAANLFGRRLVKLWEAMVSRIPLVRSVYSAVKQLVETMFADNGRSFRKVVLVEFPRRGLWTLAFLTNEESGPIQEALGRELVSVYIPTTPNPTGGYFVLLPKEEVRELEMSVDDGLKMLLSMGAVNSTSGLAEAQAKP
ncbi:MAG: DUF502 domain-containing protein [Candidatus Thiodiazotropha lotti]|uniref:DUF502 domain-containing protein n=1 Tax=Candidatus Thiodiazotropha endoloripes TaxID=1818881 RepID=A0A1E2UUL7_9GAMM|nr:DUF502 domain-containing protein [Candidatus Thiodiazotropha endoloripes]MCG7897099.1 DUF502 domain-containing protein [Candidatus Thiodiazotropha weberae]MCG7991125.1 DUF502 domain-containing protein [Candidatus Thiodiazotropha lotti]MCG7902938.1 DUF502 domain-containing protein [Candidatus Thiodiazotropha weberae]MCG8001335.1 DUF502 domain-containing protein [Candidatus Thiodiazotropha lotti]MCW4182780.1 DUF502 domain-containing protein [Candidatus Thiodiazotropha weberae]